MDNNIEYSEDYCDQLGRTLKPSSFDHDLLDKSCGLLPVTTESERQFQELQESAVTVKTLGIGVDTENKDTDARIIKFDDDFMQALDTLGKYNEVLWRPKAGQPVCCAWHWIIGKIDREPEYLSNRLVISQGNVGSCSGHSATNACQLTKLSRRAMGVGSKYEAMNRIATWYASKGNSMSGGQVLSYQMEYQCYMGMFPERLVGNSISTRPDKYKDYRQEAKEFQAYCVAIPWNSIDFVVNVIFLAARAGFATQVGNTKWPTSKQAQGKGPARAVFSSGGGHATMAGADWRPATVNTSNNFRFSEAIFFVNSHGDKYTANSEKDEPKYGCWLTREDCKTYLQTAKNFGSPIIYIPEITLLQQIGSNSTGNPALNLKDLYKYTCPEPLEMVDSAQMDSSGDVTQPVSVAVTTNLGDNIK